MNALCEVLGSIAVPASEEIALAEKVDPSRFELLAVPHLAAAVNLARWLTHSDHDAEDVVQEAYLRAFRFFDGFQGGDFRPWLLAIVRNTCMTWLQRNRRHHDAIPLDHATPAIAADIPGPDSRLLSEANRELVQRALAELPMEYREAVVLREMEGLSYQEIATVTGTAIGTVMSRLARGRKMLRETLLKRQFETY
jgi:RNA polymerase sigma-70 factor (ECF subfamily)